MTPGALCPTCQEPTSTTNVKAPGSLFGRACRCARERKEQAKLDRLKPRCEVQIADRGVYVEKCGDHEGHEGPHGQELVNQVMK